MIPDGLFAIDWPVFAFSKFARIRVNSRLQCFDLRNSAEICG